eukprot:COSAG06_NODE_2478_length_6797_cov_23.033000_6_plen_71_part_00
MDGWITAVSCRLLTRPLSPSPLIWLNDPLAVRYMQPAAVQLRPNPICCCRLLLPLLPLLPLPADDGVMMV